ncbi:hypothetical protein [Dasania marina]|uniref:hypothetical protein n=1 Tax=Dasania marina TaxID=471499 RepID=UPI0030D7E546|tara:strand:- start:98009 stop:98536 length:528 start_codon:yes stop_codon:yes gene_type:complete
MVQNHHSDRGFPPSAPKRQFYPVESPSVTFPIQSLHIDWDCLIVKQSIVLDTIDTMPVHLLKPEVLLLLDAEKHPTCRLIKNELIFPRARQTVNRYIQALIERVGRVPFTISARMFRHAFAIHLLLLAQSLKIVSQLLMYRFVDSTEIYTGVLTVDAGNFLDGVVSHENKNIFKA